MLNFCVFVFIIYAVGYSARVILFGNSTSKRRKAYNNSGAVRRKTSAQRKAVRPQKTKRKSNVTPIRQAKKSGRSERSGRPVIFLEITRSRSGIEGLKISSCLHEMRARH